MKNNPLPRLDTSPELRDRLLPHRRLKAGDIWEDPEGKHRVGCLDPTDADAVIALVGDSSPSLAIYDPPYNLE
jgi:site-specific DNA-methyltransferase (adenine-specific)